MSPLKQRRAMIAAANAGDADAQSKLGDVYREGDRLAAQDYAEAFPSPARCASRPPIAARR